MTDFIIKYWLQALFGAIISVLTLAVRHLYARSKEDREEREERIVKESQEQEVIKEGILAILHDRLYELCAQYIAKGEITVGELHNLEYLYESYHALGGNGTGTVMFNKCRELKIVPD